MRKAGLTVARVSCGVLAAGMLGAAMLAASAAGSTSASTCTWSGKCFAVTVSPTNPAAGASTSFAFAIKNEASTQQLGSVQISAPSGFVITGASGSASFTSSSALFLNLSLAPSANDHLDRERSRAVRRWDLPVGDRGQAVKQFQRSPWQRLPARSREHWKPLGHADGILLARVHERRAADRHRRRRGDHLWLRLPGRSGQGRGPGRIRPAGHELDRSRERRHRVEPRFWIAVGNGHSSTRAGASPRSPTCRSTGPASDTPSPRRARGLPRRPRPIFTIWGSLQHCSTTPCSASSSTATTSGTVTTSSVTSTELLGSGIGGVQLQLRRDLPAGVGPAQLRRLQSPLVSLSRAPSSPSRSRSASPPSSPRVILAPRAGRSATPPRHRSRRSLVPPEPR